MNIPSFLVKEGDVVQVKEKSRDLVVVLEALISKERDVPDYFSLGCGKRHAARSSARRSSLMCLIRCRWNRTW